MLSIDKKRKLTFKCSRCLTTKADKLAWFQSDSNMWADSLLCRICFNEAFNLLTTKEKMTWRFYATKK